MKNKLLEKKKYPAACEYCKHGRLSPDEQSVLCIKKGLVAPDGKCLRYSYDPLKRRPKKPPMLQQADPSDFDLNIDSHEPVAPPAQFVHKNPKPVSEPETEPKCEKEPAEEPKKDSAPAPDKSEKTNPYFEPVHIFSEDF